MKSILRLLLSIIFAFVAVVVMLKFLSWSNQNDTTALISTEISSHAPQNDEHNQSHGVMPAVQSEIDENLFSKAFQTLTDLPLRFIANAGQTDPAVNFTVKGAGHTLFFTQDEVVFSAVREVEEQAVSSVVRLSFEGANPGPQMAGLGLMPGVVNYFLGNDPQNWHTSVDTYAGVSYRELYTGIELVYRGARGGLKSEFVVAPGGDPGDISMVYSGVQNAFIREDGALVLETYLGQLEEGKPLVYQQVDGAKRMIPAGYLLENLPTAQNGILSYRVSFEIGEYDPDLPLLVDPVLAFSSFIGGSQNDKAHDIAVDDSSNIYITGLTGSSDFPTTTNAISSTFQSGDGGDIFVTQIIESGGVYTYGFSTYLGGSGNDTPHGIAVDSAGDVYIAGITGSDSDFPIVNAPQPTFGGSYDGFVAKITNIAGSASLAYSSYLGGTDNEGAYDNAVDSAGNHYVTGETKSTKFPTTTNAIQPSFGGESLDIGDIFVTKIISAGGVYTYGYSSFLGGTGGERGTGIAVGDDGDVYVTGWNYNSSYPMVNQLQTSQGGGDAVVTKLRYTGIYTYEYSTYLGGGNTDWGFGIAVDDSDNAYVTGVTYGAGFPITNAIQMTFGGSSDIFVTMLESTGGKPNYGYSTYIGGSNDDYGLAIAVDGDGNAHVTGNTKSSNFPTRSAIQPHKAGIEYYKDAIVTKIISATGVYTYAYSTYIGGSNHENEYDEQGGIAVDDNGNVYVAGTTGSSDLPITPNAIQSTKAGESWAQAAFVLKIIGPTDLQISKSVNPPGVIHPGEDVTYTLVYTNNSPLTVSGVVITDTIPISLTNINFTSSGALITATQDVTYVWQVDPLSPDAVGFITITGLLDPSVSEEFTMTNQAIIATEPDAYLGDDNPDNNISAVQNLVDVSVVEPIAGLSASNDSPTIVGNDTTLTATITSGSDVTYNWDFGDSTGDSGAVATHTYPTAGIFTATVTVSNTVSLLSQDTIVSIIEPVAGLTAGNDSPTILGNATTLTATITGGSDVSYSWDFGDSINGAGAVVSHVYPQAGVFEAQVTASNSVNNLTDSTYVTIMEQFNIPVGGGTYTSSDDVLTIEASGDVTEVITINYTPQLTTTQSAGEFEFAGVYFHLEAEDGSGSPITDLTHPMTLTVSYDESALPPGVDENDLEIYRYDTTLGNWVALAGIVDPAADTITVILDHFSEFVLGAPTIVKKSIYVPFIVR